MAEDRLDRIEQKVDALADRFAGMDRRLVLVDRGLNQKLALADEKMEAGFNRIESLLKSVVDTQTHINGELSDKVAGHEERITALEKKA